MTLPDADRQEEVHGRLRGVLIQLSDQLPAVTVQLAGDMIDANEGAIALDMITEMLVEGQARLDAETVSDIARLANDLGLQVAISDRLAALVVPEI